MVFPTAEVLTLCLTSRMSSETRNMWKEPYRVAEKYGIRTGFGEISGAGFVTLAKEDAVIKN